MPSSAYASAVFLPLPTPRGSLPSPLQDILGPHFSVTSLKLTTVCECSYLGQKSWVEGTQNVTIGLRSKAKNGNTCLTCLTFQSLEGLVLK